MPEKIYSVRLEDESQATVEDLREAWGPIKRLTASDVIREALRRAWMIEARKKKRKIPADPI